MKTNISKIMLSVLVVSMSSCSDYFLNLEPTDTQTEANYYKSAAQFEAAANGTYSFYGFRSDGGHSLYNLWDTGSDIFSINDVVRGTLTPSESDGYWNTCYSKIRNCNVVLDKAASYDGGEDITVSVATARFFRAYQYFWLVQRFGGVPIVKDVLITTSPEVYAPRNSRYEVIALILEDLDFAIKNLPEESSYNGKLTKQGAQAFKARVLLLEATWEKYVKDTTDGDGSSSGAGSTKPSGYPTIENMLTEAASLADAVMSSGKYELWNAEGTPYECIAYNYLFNLEDENTNPMGYGKSMNHEYILQVCHDPISYKCGINITHSYGVDSYSSIGGNVPLKWMLMVPCATDGLPYFYSEDYKGFNLMTDIYDNRDYRLTSTILRPGDKYYFMGVKGADKSTYALADYVTCFDFPDACMPFYPNVTSTGATGYQNRKMTSERKDYSDTDESFNYPILRLAEVYLIYAEAKCEIGNGNISDADLDKSINLLHKRGGTASISNASVAKANANYAANTGNAGSITMIDLIRNERAVELRCENHRPFDLLRWGIAETEMKHNTLGVVVKNPDGTPTQIVNFTYNVNGQDVATWSDAAGSAYGYERLDDGSEAYITSPASLINMKRQHYLYPIPLDQIKLNPALLQNPGY